MRPTPLCRQLGIEVPVIQAPIGSATTPALAAAVANAGGLGTLAITWLDSGTVAARVAQTRELTAKPIAVNVSLAFSVRDQLEAALDGGVRIVSTFWGRAADLHAVIASAGAIHLHTVGSPQEAARAVDDGVDVVVAQGWEAGGHVWGRSTSLSLIPAVVDAVDPVPVVAAGGIADGRGLAAALMLGAQAVWMGTRFLASHEASTHARYRARLIAAEVTDTSYTTCFDGGWPDAPHRVLGNNTLDAWERAGRPGGPHRPGEGDVVATDSAGGSFQRYDDMMPTADLAGDLDEMALYAGQSAGLVHDVLPAAQIVTEIAAEAQARLRAWAPR
jgi:NAD(P)H-dependent flavin oxidoreductase YrpB (nitropropane dioxygenase family)